MLAVAESMHWFSDYSIHWGHWPKVFELARAAAHAIGDKRAEATQLNYLAWARFTCQGRTEEALDTAVAAAALAREAGDPAQEAWAAQYAAQAERQPARLAGEQGRPREERYWLERSLVHAEQAAAGLRSAGDREGHPQASMNVAESLRMLGRTAEALAVLDQVVGSASDPATAPAPLIAATTRAIALSFTANIHIQTRDFGAAERAYRRALEDGDEAIPEQVGSILHGLGRTLRELGRTEEAAAALRSALDLSAAINDERRAAVVRRDLDELSAEVR